MEPSRRLNLITGDNGLGKSFLLDIAWWTLTRTWAGHPARPIAGGAGTSSIGFAFEGKRTRREYISDFDREVKKLTANTGVPSAPKKKPKGSS